MKTTPSIPKMKKVADVGETPFYFLNKEESILQGWDNTEKKSVYLFKTDTGSWGYYDKETNQVIDVEQWKGKAAWIDGRWVKMGLYHRVRLKFEHPILFSGWNSTSKKNLDISSQEAIVTITDTAYKSLLSQTDGRPKDSLFRFEFSKRKIKKRNVIYVSGVVWIKPQ